MAVPAPAPNRSIWDRLARHLVSRRWIVLFAAACTTAFCLTLLPVVPFSSDPTEFLPRDQKDVKFWLDMTKRFGGMDLLMIGLEEPGEPLSFDGLASVARVTDQLTQEKARGVLNVSSLTGIQTMRESNGTVNAELLINAIPRTNEERDKLVARIQADTQVNGAMISYDMKGYMLLVRADSRKDGREVASAVMEVVEKNKGSLKAYYFGAPFIAIQLTKHMYSRIQWLVPLIVLLVLGVAYIGVRRPWSILATLVSSGLAIVWWFGLASLLRVPLSASAMIVALFIPVLASFVYARGAQRWRTRAEGEIPAVLGGTEVGMLIVLGLASLVTLAFDAPFLHSFALAMASGALAVLLFGLFAVPAILTLLPRDTAPIKPCCQCRVPVWVAIPVALILTVGACLLPTPKFMMTPKDIFSPRDEVGQALAFFDRRLGGSDFLQVSVKGDLRDPGVAARVARFTDLLEGSNQFADVRSVTQVVCYLAQNFGGLYRVPSSAESLNNLWFFLDGQEDVKALALDGRDEAMISARLPGETAMKPAEWVSLAEKAVKDSTLEGDEAARLRLSALAAHYKVAVPTERLTAALVIGADHAEVKALIEKELEPRLKAFLEGDESAFKPTEEEWPALFAVLGDREKPLSAEAVAAALAAQPSYKAADNPPELAADVASMLVVRRHDILLDLQTSVQLGVLMGGQDLAKLPKPFVTRAKGVLAERLDPAPKAKTEAVFTVSGYPAVEAKLGAGLSRSVWISAAAILGMAFLGALVVSRRPKAALAALLEAALAASLTLAIGAASGVQMDTASATLYLLPIYAVFLLSPRLWAREGEGFTHSPCYAMAFAVMCLPFLATALMPLVRVGAVTALGLGLSAVISRVSEKVR